MASSTGSDQFRAICDRDTQEVVAAEVGVSQQTVSDWKNGTFTPRYTNLKKIQDKYGIAIDDWFKPLVKTKAPRRRRVSTPPGPPPQKANDTEPRQRTGTEG